VSTAEETLHAWIDRNGWSPNETDPSDINPSTGRVLASVPNPTPDDVDRVCAEAKLAHQEGRWRSLPVLERSRVLTEVASLIRQHDQELARLIAEEMGMPESQARFVEVPFAADTFSYYAGWAAHIQGSTAPTNIPGAPPEYLAYTLRQPIGPAAVITPWNFPLLLPSWHIAAALAAGCPVVLKPAPESPLTAMRLVELLEQADLPEGVVQVLPGDDQVGEHLVRHPDIPKISFTGETDTGRKVLAAAAAGIKRVSAELGGKSALVIFSDYDLDQAVSQALFGAFFNSGQVCQALSRILVEDSIYPAFVERLVDRMASLRLGDATDPSTDLGPLVSRTRQTVVQNMVSDAVGAGATLALGGQSVAGPGFFFQPTVLTNVTPTMEIARREIFGPVATVERFHGEDEAIRLADATLYGLAAGILTHDVRRALRFAREVEAGTVWVNTVQVLSPTLPFGGFKQSGVGRALGEAGLAEYLETKTVLVDLNEDPMLYF
jgi:aldehyde dehydrogenase (NAD+)